MPRLVRRQPLSERIKAFLDPFDFLLWVSEELHDSAWDEALKDWAVPIGLSANLVLIIARANSGGSTASRGDNVFGDFDGRRGTGWFAWLCSFTAHLLALLSILNALYTFLRKRHYRLFESSIDQPPSTPSARRVRVDSSPISSSPMRFFSSIIASTTAESRAHPDEKQDVWEVAVWDPRELNLELFTLFSPGHVLIYWLFLPTAALDPRPSVTVVTTMLLGALLSLQAVAMRRSFTRQAKDSTLIHKEVMNEYDTKFVHPSLNKPVRDVGTQSRESATSPRTKTREVDVYTPTTLINRGFKINPNPSYTGHLGEDEDAAHAASPLKRMALPRSSTTPAVRTPVQGSTNGYSSFGQQTERTLDFASPSKQFQPRERSSMRRDGGSLGVYSHAASPLRKAASSNHLRPGTSDGARTGSPLKRMSTPGNVGAEGLTQRFGGLKETRRDPRPY